MAPGDAVVRMLVFDEDDEIVPVPLLSGFGAPPFRNEEIMPGDSVILYGNLDNSLWDPVRGPWWRLAPGNYSVVIYLNGGVFGDGEGLGIEPVDTLPFTVAEFSERDSLASELYEEAYDNMRGRRDLSRCVELLQDIVEGYPGSPLRERAYQLSFLVIGSTLAPDRRAQQTEICRDFLKDLPMSPYSRDAAAFLRGQIVSQEYDSLMNELRQNWPSSPVFDGRLPAE